MVSELVCFHKASAVEKHISDIMYENPRERAQPRLLPAADAHSCSCIAIFAVLALPRSSVNEFLTKIFQIGIHNFPAEQLYNFPALT